MNILPLSTVVISYATLQGKPLLTSHAQHCRAKLVPRPFCTLRNFFFLLQSLSSSTSQPFLSCPHPLFSRFPPLILQLPCPHPLLWPSLDLYSIATKILNKICKSNKNGIYVFTCMKSSPNIYSASPCHCLLTELLTPKSDQTNVMLHNCLSLRVVNCQVFLNIGCGVTKNQSPPNLKQLLQPSVLHGPFVLQVILPVCHWYHSSTR